MIVIVPDTKRATNLAKHGIDLADFESAFSWEHHLVGPAKPSHTGRVRERYIGLMHDVVVVAIVSPLGSEALAVISIRPASLTERRAYENEA